ncbi:MAG: 30S ribosomal protein S15 [Nitrosarchaeum sp.]|nr:30S ribosomal protein S15 [Nitrosarchaeum sp.]
MARMHSGARGKSRSTKPADPQKPSWLEYKGKEVELLIVKYAKEGNNASKIGIILRDKYGIPSVQQICEKSISEILIEKQLAPTIPEDLIALMTKAISVRKHLEENKHDETARRGLILTESKIGRLSKYYKKTGKIPADWKYDPDRAKVFLG